MSKELDKDGFYTDDVPYSIPAKAFFAMLNSMQDRITELEARVVTQGQVLLMFQRVLDAGTMASKKPRGGTFADTPLSVLREQDNEAYGIQPRSHRLSKEVNNTVKTD